MNFYQVVINYLNIIMIIKKKQIIYRPSRLGFPEGTLTSVCVYDHETIKLNTDHYFIEQYHRQRAPLKHLCRCVLLRPINWNLDQNLGRICNRRRYCS